MPTPTHHRHDLPEATRGTMIDELNAVLATVVDLHAQSKQAHWNVRGPGFIAVHELFDTLAGELDGHADMLAERITALGGLAAGDLRQAVAASALAAWPADLQAQAEVVETLTARYAETAARVRTAIAAAEGVDDAGTADLFTEVSRALDKATWFLDAHTG